MPTNILWQLPCYETAHLNHQFDGLQHNKNSKKPVKWHKIFTSPTQKKSRNQPVTICSVFYGISFLLFVTLAEFYVCMDVCTEKEIISMGFDAHTYIYT
jgi:hypothetical protein